jgi:hypothetical protein
LGFWRVNGFVSPFFRSCLALPSALAPSTCGDYQARSNETLL